MNQVDSVYVSCGELGVTGLSPWYDMQASRIL